MKNKEKTTWLQTAGILLFAAACTMALYSLYLCFGSDIWYDELFTEGFISQPVGRMISLAVKDVHPPLYYLLVKIAVDFCRFFVPSANAVIISKVVSVLPYLGLLGYSLVFLRRRYGWLCAGLFSFCIFAMPQMANYTTEVRMYGFALFFITAAFFHAGAILENGGKRNWIALTVFGICAAYTHYFAAVSAAVLYVGLAVLLYVRKKDTRTKSLLTWLLAAGSLVLISGIHHHSKAENSCPRPEFMVFHRFSLPCILLGRTPKTGRLSSIFHMVTLRPQVSQS